MQPDSVDRFQNPAGWDISLARWQRNIQISTHVAIEP